MDPVKTNLHINIFTLKGQALIDFYGAVAYRLMHRLSDLASRNFLHVDGRVYSIDKESEAGDGDINLLNELKKRAYNYLKDNYRSVDKTKIHADLKAILDKEFI